MSTLANARRDAASATVQQLRLRLLDLTGRNPLISFDHGSRSISRANVRAIDAGMDGIYARLIEPGKPIPLRPLPPMPKGPSDEATPTFESAFELAKHTDGEYATAMGALSPEDAETAKASKIERKLKDRVRERLGMPPVRDVAAQSLAEHAKRFGIDPSFDLPATSTKVAETGRQRPFEIQTLLDQEQLDRRLSKIRESARLYAEETGVSALYTAWGFLEWFEADNSERAITSPILLLRTDLERTIHKARFQYVIEEAGEDVQVNLTLAERLKRDFQIVMPTIAEEELPSDFLARVDQEVCKDKPRWRVRRFVTLALLPFARLAMFNDLDEEHWTAIGGLPDHPVVGELLGGSEAGGALFASEHDVDSGAVRAAVPTMVMEADASQHSAVYDAITGKNLVIEGPPGTGKSQTITNLIAAALGAGKRVLFVADKQTALQVVKDRLDSVGLGDFCLEIHSGKARKKDVVDALGQRLARRPAPPVRGIETRRADVLSVKRDLNAYAAILNGPFGAEENSVHDIIWADRRRRQVESEEARRLDELKIRGAERMTQTELANLKTLARRYELAAAQVLDVAARPGEHPWFGVLRSNLPSTDIEVAQREVEDLAVQLEALQAQVATLPVAIAMRDGVSLVDVMAAVGPVVGIRIPTHHPAAWHQAMLDDARRRETVEWLKRVRTFREAMSALEAEGQRFAELPSRTAVEALLALVDGEREDDLPTSLTAAALGAHVDELRREAEAMERLASTAAQCLSVFGIRRSASVGDLAAMIRIVDLLADADERVLAAVSPALLAREAADAVAAAADRLAKMRARRAELDKDYDLAKAGPPDALRRHADALRGAGLLAFMSGPVKEAHSAFAAVRRDPSKTSRTQAAEALAALSDHASASEKLEADIELKALFGRWWKGLDTDERIAADCAALGRSLRASLVGYDDITVELRRVLAEADDDRFRAAAALRARVLNAEVRRQVEALAAGTVVDADLALRPLERGRRLERRAEAARAVGLPGDLAIARQGDVCRALVTALDAEVAAACPDGVAQALGNVPRPRDGDLSPLETAIEAVEILHALNVAPGLGEALCRLSPTVLMDEVVAAAVALERAAEEAVRHWEVVRERLQVDASNFFGTPFLGTPLGRLAERCRRSAAHRDELGGWIGYLVERHEAVARGLEGVLELWDKGLVTGDLPDVVERTFWRSLTREAFARHPELNRCSGFAQEQTKQQFRDLDRQLVKLGREEIVAKLLLKPIPPGNGEGRRSEFTDLALIHNELAKKTKHVPIRALLDRAGAAVQALKPCFMMSPLSVAQYMKPGSLRFDLLVIDEASQMRPEDAVGAIARCDQIVVVGDPKQLPPTAFFDKNDAAGDEDDDADESIDAESILDQALARFRPARRLRWHYRSRHGSLIAFSNKEFYENDLIVFPSPRAVGPDVGVSLEKVDGLYLARSNVPEAMAVCRAAATHMRERPDRSLGIATLNTVQRQLIVEEMDRLATIDAAVEEYMARWNATLERFFVKNLENVQGDERDAIFVSTVFGPSEPGGPVRQNFGPINKPGGHRRLNVLFTRAKHQLRVFTSMSPDQIVANPEGPRGARVLRSFLTFAATGRLEGGTETGREPDSDFEVFVAERLRLAGYECAMQVGVAGFFLDVAVRDPARPDVFLCGVECDGASYHSSKSARDRDILRQQILEGLGWNIYRIWSTDWFRDPNGQTAKLVEHLRRLRGVTTSPSQETADITKVFA